MIVEEQFETYAGAADRATILARTFNTPVQVLRTAEGSHWIVQRPLNYEESKDPNPPGQFEDSFDDDDFDDDDDSVFDSSYIQEELDRQQAELAEELESERENWASSNEGGWFYPE